MVPLIARSWSPKGETPMVRTCGRWTKVSAISALSATAKKRRVSLYLQFHNNKNIRSGQVIQFLRHLLRHIPRTIILLWDNIPTHKSKIVTQFLKDHPRIQYHHFPGYAPELNPDEFVWSQMKRRLANSRPLHPDELLKRLQKERRRLQQSQRLMSSCIHASELPWQR